MNPWVAVAVLFCSSILWGLSWWPMKTLANAGLDGVPLIWVAYGSVGVALLPVLWRQRAQWWPHRRSLALIFVLGGSANLAFAGALTAGEVIRVMALFYLLPVWGILGGRLFLNERLTFTRVLAVGLSLSGAFILLGGPAIFRAPPSWIDIVAILSGFFFSMNNLAFRGTPELPVPSKVAVMFVGCGVFASLILVTGDRPFPDVTPSTLAGAVAFGLCGLLLATSATQWAVTRMEAGRSAIIMVMELVASVISAAWLLDSTLAMHEWAGAALITAAAILEARTVETPPA